MESKMMNPKGMNTKMGEKCGTMTSHGSSGCLRMMGIDEVHMDNEEMQMHYKEFNNMWMDSMKKMRSANPKVTMSDFMWMLMRCEQFLMKKVMSEKMTMNMMNDMMPMEKNKDLKEMFEKMMDRIIKMKLNVEKCIGFYSHYMNDMLKNFELDNKTMQKYMMEMKKMEEKFEDKNMKMKDCMRPMMMSVLENMHHKGEMQNNGMMEMLDISMLTDLMKGLSTMTMNSEMRMPMEKMMRDMLIDMAQNKMTMNNSFMMLFKMNWIIEMGKECCE
uniref:Uncharacterized protein n=1 Tax=Rhabditophanes sp. KR3021 TaxID=114890 RepID=A0AC35U1H0_9BILA